MKKPNRSEMEKECSYRGFSLLLKPKKRKSIAFTPVGKTKIEISYPAYYSVKMVMAQVEKNWGRVITVADAFAKRENIVGNYIPKEDITTWLFLAEEKLQRLTEAWAQKMGERPLYCKVKTVKSIWGSCTGKNGINLNIRLIYCPKEIQEYVIIHELCHIRHKNHQQSFWEEVKSFDPNYKMHQKWLRTFGSTILALPLGCENVTIGQEGEP
ncbi:MAG: M48 family metallopeptidase [Clostridiales bacterium]|nr:M48 family metallopeptidase [Clostridiales bacterium]